MQRSPNETAHLRVFFLQALDWLLQLDQLRVGYANHNGGVAGLPLKRQMLEMGGEAKLQREPPLPIPGHSPGEASRGSGQDVVPGQGLRPAQFGQVGIHERGRVFVLTHLQTAGNRRVQVRQRRH